MGKKKYQLEYISDEDLFKHVYETVSKYATEVNLKRFNKNLIDPIKLTFDSIIYNHSFEETIENEVVRQIDKSNSNLIGYFHQNIFKFISNRWDVPKKGYDIQNIKENIYVEMKNKHNTMNSSATQKTYMRFKKTISENKYARCFLVEVIAKKSQNIPWITNIDGKRQEPNERIRRVSIDKFYEMVTKDKFAFKKLCLVLPDVINDTIKLIKTKKKNNLVGEELKMLSSNTISHLYQLSFEKYEGFKNFEF